MTDRKKLVRIAIIFNLLTKQHKTVKHNLEQVHVARIEQVNVVGNFIPYMHTRIPFRFFFNSFKSLCNC